MKTNLLNLAAILIVFVIFGLACSSENNSVNTKSNSDKPLKLDSYTIKGIKFAYYKIPAGLEQNKLIEMAQILHEAEPDTQLILVDDDSKVAQYIEYAKGISSGNVNVELPNEWANKHIVANVQKYMSGKFVVCEGNGYKEIAQLK